MLWIYYIYVDYQNTVHGYGLPFLTSVFRILQLGPKFLGVPRGSRMHDFKSPPPPPPTSSGVPPMKDKFATIFLTVKVERLPWKTLVLTLIIDWIELGRGTLSHISVLPYLMGKKLNLSLWIWIETDRYWSWLNQYN